MLPNALRAREKYHYAGQPYDQRALRIKNRRKGGDFYYKDAYVLKYLL
jgi:hypothetical protein